MDDQLFEYWLYIMEGLERLIGRRKKLVNHERKDSENFSFFENQMMKNINLCEKDNESFKHRKDNDIHQNLSPDKKDLKDGLKKE